MVDDADHGAELGELGKDVARDDDRLAHALELFQDLAHLDARTGVEAGSRLVQEQDCRVVDQGARQADPLLQTSRQGVDELVLAFGQADEREQVIHDRLSPSLLLPVARRVEVEVFADGQLVVHAEEIRHVADARVHFFPVPGHVGAVDEGFAFGRLQ